MQNRYRLFFKNLITMADIKKFHFENAQICLMVALTNSILRNLHFCIFNFISVIYTCTNRFFAKKNISHKLKKFAVILYEFLRKVIKFCAVARPCDRDI